MFGVPMTCVNDDCSGLERGAQFRGHLVVFWALSQDRGDPKMGVAIDKMTTILRFPILTYRIFGISNFETTPRTQS